MHSDLLYYNFKVLFYKFFILPIAFEMEDILFGPIVSSSATKTSLDPGIIKLAVLIYRLFLLSITYENYFSSA